MVTYKVFSNNARIKEKGKNEPIYHFFISLIKFEFDINNYVDKHKPYSIIWQTTTPVLMEDDFKAIEELFSGSIAFTYVQLLQTPKQTNII